MIVLILAAGDGSRWYNNDRPKQLALIRGKPIIQRTIDLVGICNSVVITHDADIQVEVDEFFIPAKREWTVDTFLSTKELWSGRTVVLLGDVIYSPESIWTILSCSDDVAVFGGKDRPGKDDEIFGVSFNTIGKNRVNAALSVALQDARANGRGKLWEFYRALCGRDLRMHYIDGSIFHSIDDYTDDIDDLGQYEQFLQSNSWAT